MIEKHSGLPLSLNPATGELAFHDGLRCDGSSQKLAGQMAGLFRDYDPSDANRLVYRAYRNIRFAEDEPLFAHWGYRYDITVILPGDVRGEFFKTSGHYHVCPPMKRAPFPEVYEVISGEIVFVLQRNPAFSRPDGGQIERLQVVHVKAGQSIIVPPYCGHGSINPADTASAFSNIAVIACPLDYEPVKARHGLAAYVVRGAQGFDAVPNPNYGPLPDIETIEPVENPALGIEFGVPCYRNFVAHPERYRFLLHPEECM